MAKQSKPKQPSARTLAAVQALKAAHQTGREMEKQVVRQPGGTNVSRYEYSRVGAMFGLSREAVQKHIAFASRYTEKELKQLCQLCLDYDRPFGFWLLVRLLPIRSKPTRERVQKKAIREGWSARRLIDYLRDKKLTKIGSKRNDIMRQGGRLPAACRNVDALLTEIRHGERKWHRIIERWKSDASEYKKLRLQLRKDLNALDRAFKKLAEHSS